MSRTQHGVIFRDGSISWRFNGSTSYERALAEAQRFTDTGVAQRPVDERGKPLVGPVRLVFAGPRLIFA